MSTERTAKNATLNPEILQQLTEQSKAEGKTPDELANELLSTLLKMRSQSKSNERWKSLLTYGPGQAKKLGIKESDPRLVKEWRNEQHGR